MGKASRKKKRDADTSAIPPHPTATLPAPPRWAASLLLVAAAAGVVLAGVSTWVHFQVTASEGAYSSFCNVNEAVNCDSVVTSPHGKLLGIPVSVWAIGFYGFLGMVTWRARHPSRPVRDRARADALGLAIAGAGFSLYMAAVSALVLQTLCILCAGLYVVSGVSLIAAGALAAPFGASLDLLRDRWDLARRRPGLASGAIAVVALILLLPAWLGAPTLMTRDEIFKADPEFYDWYTNQPVVEAPSEGGHAQGPEGAPIQLVEFSDFECPHCRRAHVTLKDLLSRYREEVRFVFHHFPLSNLCNDAIDQVGHERACEAAVASECAGEQGKFHPYANQLFANQGSLDTKKIRSLAGDVGLDTAAFEKCLSGESARSRVAEDIAAARRSGVRSTPTFFINGRRLEGNLTYERWLLAFGIELDRG